MNFEVDELPDGWTLVEAVICFKAIDENGKVRFGNRHTPGMLRPEAIGLMQLVIADQLHAWVNDPGEDDE